MRNKFSKAMEGLVSVHDKLIVAVSGGMDSIALLDLLSCAGYHCIVAHCNFQLRATASDEEALFVESLALKYKFQFKLAVFNTLDYAKENKISIEMAARELRYKWFEEIRQKNHARFIAVAHHADDQTETILLNLTRGTGLKGLIGMQAINGHIIRPMLEFKRKEIENYCDSYKLEFRTDLSNFENIYIRNRFRNQIIPEFEKINPQFKENIVRMSGHLDQSNTYIQEKLKEDLPHFCRIDEMQMIIDLNEKFRKHTGFYLHALLSELGFGRDQVDDISGSLDGQSGKIFFSPTHELVLDRNKIILRQTEKPRPGLSESFETETEYLLDLSPLLYDDRFNSLKSTQSNHLTICKPIQMDVSLFTKTSDFKFSTSNQLVHLDAGRVEFPLKLRKWNEGDKFRPLGMKNFRKVSDFFTDLKLNLFEKKDIWILVDRNDRIVWLVGCRLDDRFKIQSTTRNILELSV